MRRFLLLAAGITMTGTALANDTTASTGAGGLVLEQTRDIDMLSEDLYVSAEEIRVRYVFKNQSASNVDTIVAFPLPDRDLSQEYGGDVAYPSGFRTTVDGRPVKAELERKATLNGRDLTSLLKKLGVPFAPGSINEATAAMDKLSPAEKKRLIAAGLAGDEEYDDDGKGMKHHLIPLWKVQERFWWKQRFPAGRQLTVEHRYVPGVGGSVESPIAFRELRQGDDIKWARDYYCADDAFIAAVDRRSRRDREAGPGMPDKRIDYILTTGANWRSPIGSFRLVVDKGKPGNLVSFCETGVKKISPTQFEVRRTNWKPTRDLHVLIIEPQQ